MDGQAGRVEICDYHRGAQDMAKVKARKLANIHPGEVLREEFLVPLGISQYRLAKEIGVTEARISAICSGKRGITADTALRLAAFFGTSSAFWLGLQADYDTEEAAGELADALARIQRFEPQAA
jgi:addiction module HigA family antidote